MDIKHLINELNAHKDRAVYVDCIKHNKTSVILQVKSNDTDAVLAEIFIPRG